MFVAAVVDVCSGKSVRGVMNVMNTDISELSCHFSICLVGMLNSIFSYSMFVLL